MKNYSKIYTIILVMTVFMMPKSWAQKTTEKLKERFNTNQDVNINVDTQYADIVFENWNKDNVEVEAVIETDGLSQDDIDRLMRDWKISVQGNSKIIRINSLGGTAGSNIALGDIPASGLDDIIASSMQIVGPIMKNMVTPMIESFAGTQLPPEYYRGMSNIEFDYDAYKRDGEKYLKEYERKVESHFGDDFDTAMAKWEKENEGKMKHWESTNIGSGFLGMPPSPFGRNLSFDSDAYEKDKKGYVAKLNSKYKTNASVKDVDKWLDNMEAWGEDFGKGMEAWGEQFGEVFGKNMEAWGENFGKAMEKDMQAWGNNFGKSMEAWGENFGKQMEEMAERNDGNFQRSTSRDANGNVSTRMSYSYDSSKNNNRNRSTSNKVRRKIIVRMPNDAKLDLNVRHGNIKIGDANNARVNLSHGDFIASTIDGDQTYINVSYSPVAVTDWNYGTLKTSYVKKCVIAKAKSINVDSRSSNVIINELEDSGVIVGTFGELSIPKVGRDFKTLNISLENSDLVLRLPDSAFHFTYNGTRSNLNYPSKLDAKVMNSYDSKMVNGFYKSRNTDSSIAISAKFSDVLVN
ncbi:hypothetical protein ACH3O9_12545 [Leeuwenhoekiella sp. A16]|uniref:hypothetical protein n=1 Tax=unclassified Leeuwenhoekiella TaxID=2615029 RepID=UPI003A7FD80E